MLPKTPKLLEDIRDAAAFIAVNTPAEYSEIRSWRGDMLVRPRLGELGKRFGAPGVAIHRTDLQAALRQQMREELILLEARSVAIAVLTTS